MSKSYGPKKLAQTDLMKAHGITEEEIKDFAVNLMGIEPKTRLDGGYDFRTLTIPSELVNRRFKDIKEHIEEKRPFR